jgi:hypothetical protein
MPHSRYFCSPGRAYPGAPPIWKFTVATRDIYNWRKSKRKELHVTHFTGREVQQLDRVLKKNAYVLRWDFSKDETYESMARKSTRQLRSLLRGYTRVLNICYPCQKEALLYLSSGRRDIPLEAVLKDTLLESSRVEDDIILIRRVLRDRDELDL